MPFWRRRPEGGISVDDALLLVSKGGCLVDVRTPPEYEAGHCPGARLVDPRAIADDPWTAVHGDDPLAEPDGVMVFVCDTGLRSSLAATQAREKGYAAEFLAGGVMAWRDAGQFLLPGPPRKRR